MKTANALLVTGPLEASIHALLRGLAFAPCYLPETVAIVEARGTAEGFGWLDRAEVDAVNDLIALHTGDAESDASAWPAWTDADVWETTPAGPPAITAALDRSESAPLPAICGGSPDEDGPPFEIEPFEPSDRDRIDWARETARIDAEDAGWLEANPNPGRVTDEDVVTATGCCG